MYLPVLVKFLIYFFYATFDILINAPTYSWSMFLMRDISSLKDKKF